MSIIPNDIVLVVFSERRNPQLDAYLLYKEDKKGGGLIGRTDPNFLNIPKELNNTEMWRYNLKDWSWERIPQSPLEQLKDMIKPLAEKVDLRLETKDYSPFWAEKDNLEGHQEAYSEILNLIETLMKGQSQ